MSILRMLEATQPTQHSWMALGPAKLVAYSYRDADLASCAQRSGFSPSQVSHAKTFRYCTYGIRSEQRLALACPFFANNQIYLFPRLPSAVVLAVLVNSLGH